MPLRRVTLNDLAIVDHATMDGVDVYPALTQRLVDDAYPFLVAAPQGGTEDWARVLFLNLTYWGGEGDVLCDDAIAADVVAHVGWHHAIAQTLHPTGPPTVSALAFGEAVASAFDIYLIGHLLKQSLHTELLATAVPRIRDVALDSGLDEDAVDNLLIDIAADPEAAFESLRALLFDVTRALVDCTTVEQGADVLDAVREHRFACLLHHFEVSNWVLHMQARGRRQPDSATQALDEAMRASSSPLMHLSRVCALL